MKHLLFYLPILLLCFAQCKDDDNEKPEEPNYGVEYFECKVNGNLFEAEGNPFNCSSLTFDYYPQQHLTIPAQYAVLGGRNCSEETTVCVRIDGLLPKTGYLDFLEPAFADSIYPWYGFLDVEVEQFVVLENLVDGEMNIEEFIPREEGTSTPYGTIKGTFEFTVTNEQGTDTIRVTEGRFRFDVPQIF